MKKVFIIFFLCLLHKQLIAQNPPGEPNIAWMETEYQLSDGNVDITFVWDMWWGENGDHWKLLQNGNVIYETEIAPNTPQPQHDEVIIIFTVTGQFDFMIDLCNYYERDEICTSSNPITITIFGGEDETEIDHGFGISDWGEQFFSPFVDATSWPPFSLYEMAQVTGVKFFNLGFIVARSYDNCQATWGGYYTLDGWTFAGDYMFPLIEDNEIGNLRELGGDVMISIGGASNAPLASAANDVEELKIQYRNVVETYNLTYLDFDIEGTWVLDTEATILRAQALVELQNEWENDGREVNIWFTLPVLPEGLTADGYAVVETTVNLGVELSGVNIMTMDYGDSAAPDPEGQMGYYAIQSAESLHSQLSQIYPENTSEEIWQMIGITPMIGLNDVLTERFTLQDAQQLTDFAIENNVKELSMWSANRDFECEGGYSDNVSIDCSSEIQDDYEFSSIFNVITDDPIPPPPTFGKNIIGYYTSWSVYVRDYHVPDIPAEKINFINYAFANINPSTGTIVLGDPYADIDKFYPGDCWEEGCLRGNFHQLQLLKADYPHVKTLISVGGWTWSAYFSDVAMTEESREIFAQSCVDFILEYDFDGIDLDWEYPVEGGLEGNNHHPDDGIHLTLLLQRMRQMLNEQETNTGRTYYLTIAASANPAMMDHLELGAISEVLDWINIMSYDFHGPWSGEGDPVTNFNSPLYSVEEDPTPEPYHSEFNLSSSVQNYIDRGVPKDKLNAGLAFYGRAFGGVSGGENGLFASYSGPAGDGTWENGVFDYWDLDTDYIDMNGYSKYWHDGAKVPWLYSPSTQIMVSYDDEESILLKTQHINDENIGGAMFWEFSGDKNGDLLNIVYETIMAGDSSETEGIYVYYNEDWNLVSVPDESVNFPCTNYIDGTLYSFEDNSYTTVEMDDITVGQGYCLRFEDMVECTFSGNPITEISVQLTAGWNLMGSISSSVDVNAIIDEDNLIVPNTIYGFDESYIEAEMIEPGYGYWIRAFQDGEITLTSDVTARVAPLDFSLIGKANTISINGSELYFGVELSEIDRLSYSLPPKPPVGAFDVRFKDGWRAVKDYGEVEVMSTSETLHIDYNIKVDAGDHMNWVLTSETGKDYILEGAGEITVPSSETFILNRENVIPVTFALHQNYPNPFNPITTLRYDLPSDAMVTLSIYDMLGKEITQLVNTTQEAGFKSVQWDATDSMGRPVSAGVYLYQIQAGDPSLNSGHGFVQTKKMVLLK